jgi:acetoin utilization protein AcuB
LRIRCGEGDMLLVRDSMTREVVTVAPGATAAEALALCRERRIRHLPVVEGGRLVGLISDRDLRSATPALGDPDRAAALETITVGDEMAREVVTAHPDDPIERAAMAMYEKRIGCLPVADGDELVGILTSSDVMKAFVRLVGAHEPGSRVEVALPDRPGALAGVVDVLREEGVNLVSVLASPEADERGSDGAARRVVVLRLGTVNTLGVVERLRGAGYGVLWPPAPDEGPGRAS